MGLHQGSALSPLLFVYIIIIDVITADNYKLVEMERTDWSDLRQESSNENEAVDIPDSDSADVALLLRNMANVS